jgi:hypothetical protein
LHIEKFSARSNGTIATRIIIKVVRLYSKQRKTNDFISSGAHNARRAEVSFNLGLFLVVRFLLFDHVPRLINRIVTIGFVLCYRRAPCTASAVKDTSKTFKTVVVDADTAAKLAGHMGGRRRREYGLSTFSSVSIGCAIEAKTSDSFLGCFHSP